MKEILCPKCGRYVGKRVVDGNMDTGALGAAIQTKEIYDFRRASHVWWHEGRICRQCARKIFPYGSYWVILHTKYGLCAGGDSGDPWMYRSKESADEKANYLRSRFGDNYVVEEQKI